MHHNSWSAFLTCFHASESHLCCFVLSFLLYFKCLIQELIPNISFFRYNKLAELENDKMNIAHNVARGDNFLEDPVNPFLHHHLTFM